jgi:NDP-sugar pyrophosphorylase family protein
MQAVILAGGKGERLLPLTLNLPKPMVPIFDKPYLYYQIDYLKRQGINDVLLLVGYLKEKVIDYFGDGEKFGVNIKYSIEKELLGTGGALKNAENQLEEVFFVIYGDSFLPIDFNDLAKTFIKSNKKGMIVVYDNSEDTNVINNVNLKGDEVIEYTKDSKNKLRYVEAGVLVLKKEVLKFIEKDIRVSLEQEVFLKLIQQKQLGAFITKQRFYDIGTKERLEKIKEYLKINNVK